MTSATAKNFARGDGLGGLENKKKMLNPVYNVDSQSPKCFYIARSSFSPKFDMFFRMSETVESNELTLRYELTLNDDLRVKEGIKEMKLHDSDVSDFLRRALFLKSTPEGLQWSKFRHSYYTYELKITFKRKDDFVHDNIHKAIEPNSIFCGEKIKGHYKIKANFRTSSDPSGIRFVISNPGAQGVTDHDKRTIASALRTNGYALVSNILNRRYRSRDPMLNGTNTSDMEFYALDLGPDHEYELWTKSKFPVTLDSGKTVHLSIRRDENVQQYEKRLRYAGNLTEPEIKALVEKRKAINVAGKTRNLQRLKRNTDQVDSYEVELRKVREKVYNGARINRQTILTEKLAKAQSDHDRDRFATKRTILNREQNKAADKKLLEKFIDDWRMYDKNGPWLKIMSQEERDNFMEAERHYDSAEQEDFERAINYYNSLYGEQDIDLENELRRLAGMTITKIISPSALGRQVGDGAAPQTPPGLPQNNPLVQPDANAAADTTSNNGGAVSNNTSNTGETHYEARSGEDDDDDEDEESLNGSTSRIKTNTNDWGTWNRLRYVFIIKKDEHYGLEALVGCQDWIADNRLTFEGYQFNSAVAKDMMDMLADLIDPPLDFSEKLHQKGIELARAAIYFFGPRNKADRARFGRNKLATATERHLKSRVKDLYNVPQMMKGYIHVLVPVLINLRGIMNYDRIYEIWKPSFGLGRYAIPHLCQDGKVRLLSVPTYGTAIANPDSMNGTNFFGFTPKWSSS